MGKSASIAKMEQDNKEFQRFMSGLVDDMKTYADKYVTSFQDSIDEFYQGKKDGVTAIEEKSHWDYQFDSQFSMERIHSIINKTADEVFGQLTDPEKVEIMKALENYKTMAAKLAVNFLSNILVALTWGQTAEYRNDTQHLSLGPGLTMHIMVVEKYYDSSKFFENQKIVQNYIFYKLAFSEDLAKSEIAIDFYTKCMKSIEESSDAYDRLYQKWMDLIISDEYLDETDTINGPLHIKEKNIQNVLTTLSKAKEDAYNEVNKRKTIQAAADAQKEENGFSMHKKITAPNEPLIVYLNQK